MRDRLWCATTNAGKLKEFRLIDAAIEPIPNMRSIPVSAEDGETFEANAAQKASYYSGFAEGLVFADDSGLEVDALGGEPGVRSARYAGEHAQDAENNALLLAKLGGGADRRARFVCVIALADAGRVIGTYRGEVEGRIIDEARGTNGFGYDPLFFYEPLGRTFAELTGEEKTGLSHRGRALRRMLAELRRS